MESSGNVLTATPLLTKATKSTRNPSNSHRKSQQRSSQGHGDNNNSTDDDDKRRVKQAQLFQGPPSNYDSNDLGDSDPDPTSTSQGHDLTITSSTMVEEDPLSFRRTLAELRSDFASTSKLRNLSSHSHSIHESDSISEAVQSGTNRRQSFVIQSSSGCHGATTGDGGEVMDDASEKRFRRRRRRRGHNTNTKRMAVDASSPTGDGEDEYSIRPAERPGPSGTNPLKKFTKDKPLSGLTPSAVKLSDAFGMKRKRPIVSGDVLLNAEELSHKFKSFGVEDDMDIGIGDVANLSLKDDLGQDDQEMKSDDDDDDSYSSFESLEDENEDDRGREADDEQSDWVFDEWGSSSSPRKAGEESSSSRKKRLLKMLRSYNSMISSSSALGVGAVGGGPSCDPLTLTSAAAMANREIRAGRRRVYLAKHDVPSGMGGIWTSANEEVSKFLQDPLQSQIRLPPLSREEGVQLGQLASLYSLQISHYPQESSMGLDPVHPSDPTPLSPLGGEGLLPEGPLSDSKLFPVLTKTANTTQMDKSSQQEPLFSAPSVPSPFNPEGSSSSNVSSVYCPTQSDLEPSDSKRIKK